MSEWPTKQTLLMRAKDKNDQKAWEDFVYYYKEFIKVLLLYFKVPESDRDDLTQVILLKIWHNLQNHNYNSEKARFRTWLHTVVKKQVYDFYHKKKSLDKIEVYDPEDIYERRLSSQDNRLEKVIDQEWRIYISNLAMENTKKAFSGKAIKVFEMYLDEISISDIAKSLDIEESSVYKLKKRVEEQLIREVKNLKQFIEF